jgi:hypothetical protein
MEIRKLVTLQKTQTITNLDKNLVASSFGLAEQLYLDSKR